MRQTSPFSVPVCEVSTDLSRFRPRWSTTSGTAEIICAIGLWRRDQWSGIAAAALLVIIWPANLQDAITAQQGHDLTTKLFEWVRFPLQIPLIWFALQSGRIREEGVPRDRAWHLG
jgi:uncharacterized membrane protein